MPYVNKRNRYIAAAKSFAENNRPTSPGRIARNEPASYLFEKWELLAIANKIGMKGVPTWVLKDCATDITNLSRGAKMYDMSTLIAASTTATV